MTMTCSRAEARCILFQPTARNISTRGSVPITQPRPKLDARQEINEHMLLVGKLHPLLVHFPIGLVLAAAGSELVAIWTRRQSWRAVAVANLRAGALFSALTVLAGWVLASVPFVEATPSLAWHRWIGVAAAVATAGAAVTSRSCHVESRRWLLVYRGALFAAATLVALAGHLGAALVWGTDFLRP
jgi:uncharacterized membrane protein